MSQLRDAVWGRETPTEGTIAAPGDSIHPPVGRCSAVRRQKTKLQPNPAGGQPFQTENKKNQKGMLIKFVFGEGGSLFLSSHLEWGALNRFLRSKTRPKRGRCGWGRDKGSSQWCDGNAITARGGASTERRISVPRAGRGCPPPPIHGPCQQTSHAAESASTEKEASFPGWQNDGTFFGNTKRGVDL